MPAPNFPISAEVSAKLVEALKLDLVGPWPGHSFANELLPENPTRWYLTGYLVPETAPVEHRSDAEAKEQMDAAGEGGSTDDGGTPDKSATPSLLPSSMGLSVLVPAGITKLHAEVTWGDYHWEDPTKESAEPADEGLGLKEEIKPEASEIQSAAAALQENPPASAVTVARPPKSYRRSPHVELVELNLPDVPGVETADTYAVVQSLFQEAQNEIVLAGYAFHNGTYFEGLRHAGHLRRLP